MLLVALEYNNSSYQKQQKILDDLGKKKYAYIYIYI